MIDESQLVFAQAASRFLPDKEPKIRRMLTVLNYLIKTAKRVRFLDGFIGKTNLDVPKGLVFGTWPSFACPP
jgi:hypothetical protein